MAIAKISLAAAQTLKLARQHTDATTRKAIKKELFASIKTQLGIPQSIRVKVEESDTTHPDYLVLKRQDNGATFNLTDAGVWDGAAAPAPVEYRWFALANDVVDDVLRDAVLDTQDWDDGAPADTDNTPIAGGFTYVKLPASDFT